MITIICKKCKKQFNSYPSFNQVFCSKSCAMSIRMRGNKYRVGKRSPMWNGGKKLHSGYILIWKPEHPRNSGGYVRQHILVMEKHLNRYLLGFPKEIVHHINGIKTDNRITNLKLTSLSNHTNLHKPRQGTAKGKKCISCNKVFIPKYYDYRIKHCSNCL